MKQETLPQHAARTVRDYHMLPHGITIVAGLSGGADSVALLHWLHTAAQAKNPIYLTAAHLNHGLRGEESDQDEAFCTALCARLGIPLHVKRVDIAALAATEGIGIEEAGRSARYAFFEELAQQNPGTKIALAHTLSDRMETMLLNMRRGAALRGLCSIPPVRALGDSAVVIRPLIECSRAQVEAYCAEHHLDFRTDSSNFELTYRRNQIRLEALPALHLNDNAMRRMFRALEADEQFLLREAGRRSQEADLPEPLQSRLRRQELVSSGIEPSAVRIQEAGNQKPKIEITPRNVTVEFEYVTNSTENLTIRGLANCLDYDTMVGNLETGTRKPGDCMHLCNGAGTKPLKKLFQERDVPPGEREQRVILRDDAGIVWLEGFGCAHRCRVTSDTKTVLAVRLSESK